MQGETVVVLGGSAGIGLAVARQALGRGAHVVVGARSEPSLAAVRERFPSIQTRPVDVTDDQSVAAFFAPLERVDHVFNAAGSFIGGTLLDGDLASFQPAFDARIWGSARAARAVAVKMPPGGSITLTGGLSTDRPVAGAWVTAVATAAAEQMARALSLELAPRRVNAIAPGWTDTPMWDPILGDAKQAAFADVAAKLPVGRLATADEVADAVLFLMNNRSVTGEVVHVDGGHRLV